VLVLLKPVIFIIFELFQEKEGALIALKEICINSGPAFSAYLQETTTEVLILTDFPDGDVRRAAIAALSQVNTIITVTQKFRTKCRCWIIQVS
jgi:hypothetical protein